MPEMTCMTPSFSSLVGRTLIPVLFTLLCFVHLKPAVFSANIYVNSDLALVAHSAAGVYNDSRAAQAKTLLHYSTETTAASLKSTIILTAANYAFRFQLQNFLCFTDRLGLKVLIASLDSEMHDFMRNSSYLPTTYFFHHEFPWAQASSNYNNNQNISAGFASFDTPKYNTITHAKIGLSYELMKLGYNVIFCDPDVVMIRDPLPWMLWQNIDYVHSIDKACNVNQDYTNYFHNPHVTGNTGFTLVRSNNRTLQLWKQVLDACRKEPNFNDQVHFWQQIRLLQAPSSSSTVLPIGKCRDVSNDELKSLTLIKNNNSLTSSLPLSLCVLNSCQYSSCSIQQYTHLRYVLNETNTQSITLHANCLVGDEQKIGQLKDVGLWMASSSSSLPLSLGTLSSQQCVMNWTELTIDEVYERDKLAIAVRRQRKINARKIAQHQQQQLATNPTEKKQLSSPVHNKHHSSAFVAHPIQFKDNYNNNYPSTKELPLPPQTSAAAAAEAERSTHLNRISQRQQQLFVNKEQHQPLQSAPDAAIMTAATLNAEHILNKRNPIPHHLHAVRLQQQQQQQKLLQRSSVHHG